jgi:hypothetical protein
VRGFLTAVFAGGLGLAVLAGPVTCPTCDPLPANAQHDVERIVARLNYTMVGDESATNVEPAKPAADTIKAESGAHPAEVAMVEPEKRDPPLATSALAAPSATSREPESATSSATPPAVPEAKPEPAPAATTPPATEATGAGEPATRATETPERLDEIRAGEVPGTEVAAATIDSEPVTPPPIVADTPRQLSSTATEDNYDPAPEVRTARKHISVKPRASKVRKSAPRTAAPKLYAPDKYHAVPRWAAQMYETPWQSKAFAFQ